jgi:hypothetical protein
MLQPLKPKEVYSQLKLTLAPWFKAQGYKRAKCQLGWYKQIGDCYIVVWCQLDRNGFDRYEGSSFILEFQKSLDLLVGAFPAYRKRFALFLSDPEREEVRRFQNEVIASFRHPAKSYYEQLPENLIESYLRRFNKIEKPYHKQNDIWFRYTNLEHIDYWAKFILKKLPVCIDEVSSIG